MPLFDFRCAECDHDFEELVGSRSSDDAVECPSCGKEGTSERQLSAFAVSGDSSPRGGGARPSGPCGSACGCHPH